MYIAEYSKSSYRKEFGLINFSYFINESKGKDIETSISLLKSLFKKLRIIHQEKLIAHLNISSANIYINKSSNEVFFGPCKLGGYEENSLWYVAPEYFYVPDSFKELQYGIKNDIWSIGCLISELFFIPCPLFQAFSQREVMRKMIDTLGIPLYEDVYYMSKQEYNMLLSAGNNNKRKKPNVYLLLDECEQESNEDSDDMMAEVKKKLFEMMMNCFLFKRSKRISIDSLIEYLDEVEDLIKQAVVNPNEENIEEINLPNDNSSYNNPNVNTNYRMNYYDKRSKNEMRSGNGSVNKTFNESNKLNINKNESEDMNMPQSHQRDKENKKKCHVENNSHNTSNSLISIETPNRSNNNHQYNNNSNHASNKNIKKDTTPTRLKRDRTENTNQNEYQNLNLSKYMLFFIKYRT